MKNQIKIIGQVKKKFNGIEIGSTVIYPKHIYIDLRKKGYVSEGNILTDNYRPFEMNVIEIIPENVNEKPVISFALPTFNNSDIIWLQIESLCRQKNAPNWELIIAEEKSDKYFGVEGIEPFKKRLENAGCVLIKYIDINQKIALSKKWLHIGNFLHRDSIGMMICGSDNYSPKNRIEITYQKLKDGFDWLHWKRGYFYNIIDHSAALFNAPTDTGLFMAFTREMIERVSENAKDFPKKGVDSWLKKNMGGCKMFVFEDITDGIHTDGFNTISHGRRLLYKSGGMFKEENADMVFDLFPQKIKEQLKKLKDADR